MLTPDKRNAFNADGYIILRQFLKPALLDPVRALIAQYVDTQAHSFHAHGQIANRHEQAPFEQRWALIAAEYLQSPQQEPLSRTWGGRELLAPAIHALYTDPHLLDTVAALLGPELTANGDFWIRPKITADPKTTYTWHQDSFYYGGESSEDLLIVSAWIPLVDTDQHNGCLKLVPGSHRHGPLASRATPIGHREPLHAVSQYGTPKDEPMQAGDVLLFHNLTLHASGTNSVPHHVRWSIDLRYMRTGQGFAWHSLGDGFDHQYPTFTARSENSDQVMNWQQWQTRWTTQERAS
jgi:hypothetical protein